MTAATVTPTNIQVPEPQVLREMYRLMGLITAASNRASAEVKAGTLQSAFYPVRGLEGVCAALGAAVRREDKLVSTYRSLGDALAKGADLRKVMAEVYGRSDGACGGKGGPMHLQDVTVGFMTSTGIVGAGLPIAVGLAMAEQLNGSSNAVVTTFGDGATSIGAFHEAMNMAALWNLPVVFLCQNNMWAEHTPLSDYAANTDLSGRARSYGMTAERVDGFDPLATLATLSAALERARAGGGPTFVEAVTYRLTGHSGSSDFSYMPKDEHAAAMLRDPAPCFRSWLLEFGGQTEADLAALDEQVLAQVDDAFTFAQASPFPTSDQRFTDIFADPKAVIGQ